MKKILMKKIKYKTFFQESIDISVFQALQVPSSNIRKNFLEKI